MTNLSTIARENALHCEAKKHGYRQTQDGVVVSFVLHPQEVPDALATASLGTRYVLALVEIGDDEKPKENGSAELGKVSARPSREAEARHNAASRPFTDLPLSQQAALTCKRQSFHTFLRESYPNNWRLMNNGTDEERAALFVQSTCGVKSRSEILPDTSAAVAWERLSNTYHDWMHILGNVL